MKNEESLRQHFSFFQSPVNHLSNDTFENFYDLWPSGFIFIQKNSSNSLLIVINVNYRFLPRRRNFFHVNRDMKYLSSCQLSSLLLLEAFVGSQYLSASLLAVCTHDLSKLTLDNELSPEKLSFNLTINQKCMCWPMLFSHIIKWASGAIIIMFNARWCYFWWNKLYICLPGRSTLCGNGNWFYLFCCY